ncbi:MAG TPA: 3-keto-5-aminohexanoate cleavage protein, partial [Candidatus Woesebacteria bacterium]|nr:3-keto-5-aminohexanoate cleavage protein [Candidatus Woesebacteria bacterium]
GIIPAEKPYFNLFFGSLGTTPLAPSSLASYHALFPANAIWSVGGVGHYQLDANVMSLALGGHIRVGLEDTIYYDRKRNKLATNQDLIKRMTRIMKLMELTVATPEETREMLF